MFSPQASPCPRFWTCVNSLSPSVRPLLLPSQKFVTISVWGRLHLHAGSPTTSAYWSDFYKGLEVLHALWWPWPVFTFARLHHQEPVWLLPIISSIISSPQIAHHQFVCLFSPRDPPNQVFHRETVTMRAQVRHRYAPLPLRWRDDALQVICASRHDFLDGGQLSCLILCQLLESFLYFVKGPFRYFHFIPESVSYIISTILCVQPVSLQHFTCSKYSMAGETSCHWPCCLLFFPSLLSKHIYACSSCQKYSHISRTCCSSLIIFQNHPRCAFFSTNSYHCHFVSGLSLLPPSTHCNISGINWLCVIPHLPWSPTTPTARSWGEVFSLKRSSQRSNCFTLLALGTKQISSSSSWSMLFPSLTRFCVSSDSTQIVFRFGLQVPHLFLLALRFAFWIFYLHPHH